MFQCIETVAIIEMWEKHAISCNKFRFGEICYRHGCKSINGALIYTRIVMMLNISNKRFRSSFFYDPKKRKFLQFNGKGDNIQFEGGCCKADAEVYLEALSRVECQWPSEEIRGMYIISSENIVTVFNNHTSFIACSHSYSIYLIKASLCFIYCVGWQFWGFLQLYKIFRLNLFLNFRIKVTMLKFAPLWVASTTPFILFLSCYCYHPSFDAHIAHASEQDMQNAYK